MIDEFTSYENSASHLLNALRNSPEFQDASLLQLRLQRNIMHARMRGRNPSQNADLNDILQQLIALSLRTTGKSFNEWCFEERLQTEPPAESTPKPLIMPSVSDYIHEIYQNLQRVHQLFSGTNKIYQFECEDALQILQEPTLSINVLNTTAPGDMIVAIHYIQHCVKEIIEQINTFSSHCEKRLASRQRYLILEKLNDILQYMKQHKAISIHIET